MQANATKRLHQFRNRSHFSRDAKRIYEKTYYSHASSVISTVTLVASATEYAAPGHIMFQLARYLRTRNTSNGRNALLKKIRDKRFSWFPGKKPLCETFGRRKSLQHTLCEILPQLGEQPEPTHELDKPKNRTITHLLTISCSVSYSVSSDLNNTKNKTQATLGACLHLTDTARWPRWLEHKFTDRKIRGSNLTSASRLLLSRLGQPGSIPALVLPTSGMAARHRKGVTAEPLLLLTNMAWFCQTL
ncbi:hypothetical protein CSKR_109843 [Clonorchis sinensis]|uniref:Uncharacterized protein n=1 Tax=Clonorchis sinensis TaxID=79923 RepID=A0A419Q271_CLOSI|nr:hypothetical protein CSKR_109843 [Clonorchis sinensis]